MAYFFLTHFCELNQSLINSLSKQRVSRRTLGHCFHIRLKMPTSPFVKSIGRLLLLLSHISRVRLCATPWTVAYQAPPSMGFPREEDWSGLPLPSPIGRLLLLLLLSHFSRVRLCATPQMAAHQAPPSLGFSRQEHWSGLHFLFQCMKVKIESEVTQLCPTLSNPMDCSLPGPSIHGIFQARVLEWGAIAFSI